MADFLTPSCKSDAPGDDKSASGSATMAGTSAMVNGGGAGATGAAGHGGAGMLGAGVGGVLGSAGTSGGGGSGGEVLG